MSYQVLARKYRPQVFEQVLGQDTVTRTLVNALTANRVAHAMLFTGPRGTGKTSIARILAKALNCEAAPTSVPCNKCRSCVDITKGRSADVLEIDGASNNSVDQIRDLRENAIYKPSLGAYKIYIIDEVHMLSTAAFNALLKILEEPPSHIIFIFATTEVHKLPATILSRCQRHDLGRVSLTVLAAHLQSLCDAEDFSIAPEVIEHIAMEADGSVRDSLSLLDRIFSAFPDGATQIDQVVASLGIADQKLMQDLALAVFDKNGAQVMALIEKIDNAGLDLKKFYAQVLSCFRDMYVVKITGPDHRSINATQARKQALAKIVKPFSADYLSMLVELLLEQENLIRFSAHTRITMETVFLKMLRIRPNVDLDEIVARLDTLAQAIQEKTSSSDTVQETESCLPRHSSSDSFLSSVSVAVETSKDQIQDRKISSGQEDSAGTSVKESVSESSSPAAVTWQDFLKNIRSSMPVLATVFSEGNVEENHGDSILVTVGPCSDFEIKRLKDKISQLQQMCKSMLGKNLEIRISDTKMVAPQSREFSSGTNQETHPLVKDAQKIFHGTIVY